MGSVPEGTLCFYCFEHAAGYIPDGAWGPMCGPCIARLLAGQADALCRQRWQRLWRKWGSKLARPVTVQAVFCVEAEMLAPYLWGA